MITIQYDVEKDAILMRGPEGVVTLNGVSFDPRFTQSQLEEIYRRSMRMDLKEMLQAVYGP